MINKVTEVERREIGYTEGENNKTKYGEWYGMQDQWCMMFQQWSHAQAGASYLLKRTASCGTLLDWAYQNNLLADSPQYGDLIIFSFKKDKAGVQETSHVGRCVGLSADEKYVFTIEGNTSAGIESTKGSQANGDCVAIKKRSILKIFNSYRTASSAKKIKGIIRLKFPELPIREVTMQGSQSKEHTVWSAPMKRDDCRTRKIPEGYKVKIYAEKINSITGEQDEFYRTIKGAFVLEKYCK